MANLFDPLFGPLMRPAAKHGRGNSSKPVPSLTFPANFIAAGFDMDFVNDQYALNGAIGNYLPDGTNTDDGRFLRGQISPTQPNFLEKSDGSLKTYTATLATVRRSNLWGIYCGIDFSNVVIQNRSLNNAAWTIVGGTVAKTGTGRTGVANSCSVVTLTATTCTITATAAVTSAARDRIGALEWKTSGAGSVALSLDNGSTTPAQTTKAIAGAGALSFKKTRFDAVQSALVNPQMKITLTGSISDTFTLDFAEGIDSGTVNPTYIALYEQPPVATTTVAVSVGRDRPTSGQAGYTGTTVGSPLATFLQGATQAHYIEFWARKDGGLITSAAGIQISEDQTVGASGFGVQTFTSGVGKKPILTTDMRAPIKNKVMIGKKATEAFIVLNDGAVITGAGGSLANSSDHDDWNTNGAHILATMGGSWRHIGTTDYDSMKTLALAGATAS